MFSLKCGVLIFIHFSHLDHFSVWQDSVSMDWQLKRFEPLYQPQTSDDFCHQNWRCSCSLQAAKPIDLIVCKKMGHFQAYFN